MSLRTGGLLAAVFLVGIPATGQENRPMPADFQQQLLNQSRQIQELQQQLTQQQGLVEQLSDSSAVPPPEEPTGMMDEADLDSRFQRLEEAILGLETQQESFLDNPSISDRVVTGRLHLDTWNSVRSSPGINVIETGQPVSTPKNHLVFRRIRFSVGGEVPTRNMSYRMEIEFSGTEGSQFRDAWIGWDDLAVFQTIRVGNQKRPYGFDHLNSSNYMVFLERPYIDEAINSNNRRFGASVYGVSDNRAFNWRLGVFDLRLVQNSGELIDDNVQPELAWRVANTWWYDECSDGGNYGHLGLSGTFAFPDGLAPNVGSEVNQAIFQSRPEAISSEKWLNTGRIAEAESYQLLGIESLLNIGAWQVGGELMNVWLQRMEGFGPDVYFSGGYVYLSCFLTGEHLTWNRNMGVLGRVEPFEDFSYRESNRLGPVRGGGAWQVAVRFSYADFNDEEILGGRGESVTAALNWYWNDHSRLQMNYIVGRIDDRLANLSAGGTAITSGDYQFFGIRTMIDF